MTSEEVNALGQILNTTWGQGSTNNPRGATQSIKPKMMGDKLVLNYTCIINFGEAHERMREMQNRNNDSASLLDACVKKIKTDFKELCGRTLKIEQVGDEEDWELLNLGQYGGRKDAYYRRSVVFEME